MQAQVITKFGGPECIELAVVAKPEVRYGQVLVRIHAASVKPVDVKIREGLPIGPTISGPGTLSRQAETGVGGSHCLLPGQSVGSVVTSSNGLLVRAP
jgi:NADPH:quinone reductase-like Zn-dependent oxidoreductase